MDQIKYFNVNWERFHQDTKALALKLEKQQNWKGIVAVTRGGLVPAAILAQELDIRWIDTICLASYSEDKKASDMNILKKIEDESGQGKDLLVVDDLVDTGRTFQWVRQILPYASLVSVYAKPEGYDKVDIYSSSVEQDQWIVFPWEEQIQQD